MFVKKDLRKVHEMFEQANEPLEELRLGRRSAEFQGSLHVLGDRSHGFDVTNLKVLSLYANKLEHMNDIGMLKYAPLRELNLGENQLSVLPDAFGYIQTLEVLWLESNNFQEFPQVVLQLSNLKSLRMSYNQIRSIPENINQLQQLRNFAMDSNQLEYIEPNLCLLENLEELYLRGNNIPELPDNIHQLRNLRALSINSNKLIRLPERLAKMEALRILYANGNPIPFVPAGFFQMQHLNYVNLGNTNMTAIPEELDNSWHVVLRATEMDQIEKEKKALIVCGTPYAIKKLQAQEEATKAP